MLKSAGCSVTIALVVLGFPLQAADEAAPSGPDAQSDVGGVKGITRAPGGVILTSVEVGLHGVEERIDRTIVSGGDGTFYAENLKPGHYQVVAVKAGFASSPVTIVEVAPAVSASVDITVGPSILAPAGAPGGFFSRFARAYKDDWHPAASNEPGPKFRGYPAAMDNPPYPFTVWPMGGTVNIGQPFAISTPLMTAIYGGSHGDWWKKSNITMYGWTNVGMNFSTSSRANGLYANAPMAYAQTPNSIQLSQFAFYIERQPDTVQTDHFDWGFRLTNLYGQDYRFTTAKGVFSQQLLKQNPDGTIGNKYGYDPVMFYIDLYFPHVAQGMNLRLGRYVSLPDIEAQLAPNNYTFTHSLLYAYDCYTQTGANATIKLSDHWTIQMGLSPGCDTAAWKPDAQWTGNACVAYAWASGADTIYLCANSINSSRYAYNNLAAYYATWYHKINGKWHTDTESWYQYETHTPNVNNPDAASLIQPNANGAWCRHSADLTCYAPEWAILNYTSRQFGKRDFVTFRNEYFDDIVGQRTGYKTRYVEYGVGWNHWLGTTVVFRPELRWEHAFDMRAYDGGTRRSQFMFAGDVIWFF